MQGMRRDSPRRNDTIQHEGGAQVREEVSPEVGKEHGKRCTARTGAAAAAKRALSRRAARHLVNKNKEKDGEMNDKHQQYRTTIHQLSATLHSQTRIREREKY